MTRHFLTLLTLSLLAGLFYAAGYAEAGFFLHLCCLYHLRGVVAYRRLIRKGVRR